jgi:hypothetical protein
MEVSCSSTFSSRASNISWTQAGVLSARGTSLEVSLVSGIDFENEEMDSRIDSERAEGYRTEDICGEGKEVIYTTRDQRTGVSVFASAGCVLEGGKRKGYEGGG